MKNLQSFNARHIMLLLVIGLTVVQFRSADNRVTYGA